MTKSEMEAELIGALIGDGYISLASGKYIIGFTGHPRDDLEYYDYLLDLIQKAWLKKANCKFRERALRMQFNSKEICMRLINHFGLCYGAGKSFKGSIPKIIFENWKLLRYTIRGIVDTNGSVFGSKKPGVEKYPAVEITTKSISLAKQLKETLLLQGFRVTKIRSHYCSGWETGGITPTYKVCLYGQNNLKHWLDEIGCSNPIKQAKAIALCRDY